VGAWRRSVGVYCDGENYPRYDRLRAVGITVSVSFRFGVAVALGEVLSYWKQLVFSMTTKRDCVHRLKSKS